MKQHLPSLLLISYLIRLLATGATIGDAIVIIALSTVYSGYVWLESKKEPVPNQDIKNRLIELETAIEATKNKMNSISIASTFKR